MTSVGSDVNLENGQFRATASRASAEGSAAATGTISPSSASFLSPSACIWPIIPQPTSPILSGLSIGSFAALRQTL